MFASFYLMVFGQYHDIQPPPFLDFQKKHFSRIAIMQRQAGMDDVEYLAHIL